MPDAIARQFGLDDPKHKRVAAAIAEQLTRTFGPQQGLMIALGALSSLAFVVATEGDPDLNKAEIQRATNETLVTVFGLVDEAVEEMTPTPKEKVN